MTKSKLPYEPPLIVNLSGGEAFAQDFSASGKLCKAGSLADAAQCQSGGSPQFSCSPGATASGDKCTSGSVAGAQCFSGSVAEANKCNPGAVATTQCKAGAVAGSDCRAGSAVSG